MTKLNPYLNFDGNCEEAFEFYKTVFGGEFPYKGKFKDMPDFDKSGMSPHHGERIMHVSLPISAETMIMGSDTGGEWASQFNQGNNISLSISTNQKPEADRLFRELSAGGVITMPLADTFWGDYFGMFTDKFGINWMISYNKEV